MCESISISFHYIISKEKQHLYLLTVGRCHAFLDGIMKLSTLGGEFVLIFDKDKGSFLGIELKVGVHFEKSSRSLLESSDGTRGAKGRGRRWGQESNNGKGYEYVFGKHHYYEDSKGEAYWWSMMIIDDPAATWGNLWLWISKKEASFTVSHSSTCSLHKVW